jgi:hypothetical protein
VVPLQMKLLLLVVLLLWIGAANTPAQAGGRAQHSVPRAALPHVVRQHVSARVVPRGNQGGPPVRRHTRLDVQEGYVSTLMRAGSEPGNHTHLSDVKMSFEFCRLQRS